MNRILTDRYGRTISGHGNGVWFTSGLTLTLPAEMSDEDVLSRFEAMAPASYVAVVEAPTTVTPLQMRRALRQLGLKQTVDAFVATLDEEVQEAWEYCTEVSRDDPLIVMASAALGMSEEDVANLFRVAGSL